jgi:hypothetical protein
MKKEEMIYLGQLIEICEKKIEILKKARETNNSVKFNETKKEIADLIKKISAV